MFKAQLSARKKKKSGRKLPSSRRQGTAGVGSVKATDMIRGQNHLSCEERLRMLDVFSLGRRCLRGNLINAPKGVSGGLGQTLFSGAQHQDKRQWAQTEMQQVPSEYEEELPYFEGYRELEETAQSACGVSSRLTQNPPQHNPVQSALGEPVLAGGAELDDFQRFLFNLSHSTVL